MSSKNPRETRENREVTVWDRDSQWTVKPRRVWILKRQGPYPMGSCHHGKLGPSPTSEPQASVYATHRWTMHTTRTSGC